MFLLVGGVSFKRLKTPRKLMVSNLPGFSSFLPYIVPGGVDIWGEKV